MTPEERRALLAEVRQASSCSHPVRLRGQLVELSTGEIFDRGLKVACKDRREVVCPACSSLYRFDAWILVSAGLRGGKGIDASVAEHPKLFLTLTAPSFGQVHTIRANRTCHAPRAGTGPTVCPHGQSTTCEARHVSTDPLLGSSLCRRCFDYRGAVLWNATASRLFSQTIQQLGRQVAKSRGISREKLAEVARFNYLKVAEVQRRGLIHFHVLLRIDGPEHDGSPPPSWLTAELVMAELDDIIRRHQVIGPEGQRFSWGSQFDIAALNDAVPTDRVTGYLAKYAVKTAGGSAHFARRFHQRREIDAISGDDHRRRLALTAWDLGTEPDLAELSLRRHANAFGFGGHLITKSRGFTTTFAALRNARSVHMGKSNELQALDGTFTFAGRGYDHPRANELAQVFFEMEKELRSERAVNRHKAGAEA